MATDKQVLTALLKKDFQTTSHCGPYRYKRLNLGLDQTPIYNALMPIPKAPIFHPYNPTGTTEQSKKEGTGGVPAAILNVNLGNEVLPFLPEAIQHVLATLKIPKENIDCFFVSQNMPWQNETLLMRPHYWLHGDKKCHDEAAKAATLNVTTACRVGIFSASTAHITIDKTKDILSAAMLNFVSHPGTDDSIQKIPMVIVSPDKIGVMEGIDLNRTDSVYSLVLTADNRLAITLHWLLNDEDQTLLANTAQHVQNLEGLISAMQTFQKTGLTKENGPLHHLQQILNVKAQLHAKNDRDNKHAADHDKNKEAADLKAQVELFNKFALQRENEIKQQQDLLKQFELKKANTVKQQAENRDESGQNNFNALYQEIMSDLKEKQPKFNHMIDNLIELKKNLKQKAEDIDTFLAMAFMVSNKIRLVLDAKPNQQDQGKFLNAILESKDYIDNKFGKLEACVLNLRKILSPTKPAPVVHAHNTASK